MMKRLIELVGAWDVAGSNPGGDAREPDGEGETPAKAAAAEDAAAGQ